MIDVRVADAIRDGTPDERAALVEALSRAIEENRGDRSEGEASLLFMLAHTASGGNRDAMFDWLEDLVAALASRYPG